jgi:TRAP-type C4-dicarboxylate transport system substrate-binding protein
MNKQDHIDYHSFSKKDYWEKLPDQERKRITNKIKNSLVSSWETMPEEKRKNYSNISSIRNAITRKNIKENDPEKYKQWLINQGKARSNYINSNPEAKEKLINNLTEKDKPWRNQEIIWNQDILTRMVEIVKENKSNRLITIELFISD